MKVEIALDMSALQSLASRVAPPPAKPAPAGGARAGNAKGRGGGAARPPRKQKKTAEELDAEMSVSRGRGWPESQGHLNMKARLTTMLGIQRDGLIGDRPSLSESRKTIIPDAYMYPCHYASAALVAYAFRRLCALANFHA